MEEKEKDPAQASPAADHDVGPPVARVREEDLEPHEGLRYIAKLFKALAVLLIVMFIAEIVIGFRNDGSAALGTILVEGTRTLVYAGFLWGAGDLALMFIESNHDLRASRILLGRLNGKIDRVLGQEPSASDASLVTPRAERGSPRDRA